jgi:Ca-activated chloride channel family protein
MVAAASLIVGASQPPDAAPDRPKVKAPAGSPAPGRPGSARALVTSGQADYEAGRLEEALAAFEAAERAAPAAAVPRYDAAAVLFRLGRYDEARERYTDARTRADAALQTKIDYALGNTSLALGDVPGAIAAYDACIASTARGAGLDAVRQDAAINRDFAYQQAQAPAIPQGQGPDDPSPSSRPDRRRSPNNNPGEDPTAEGDADPGPSTGGTGAEDEAEKDGRERLRRRRMAGAGGGRTTPPGSAGESREDRLDTALDNIRAAQSRRLPEEPPLASAGTDGRDW